MLQDYLMIGEVLKPQGLRGECKIKPYAADPDRFRAWNTLYLQAADGYTPLPCRVVRMRDGFVYAVLGACASAEDAEKLRGKELYIDRAHAAPPEEGGVYIADLIGCEAVDEEGHSLGKLTDVLQHGSVDTWVFRDDKGVWMAPALLAAFPEVDPARGIIRVCSERLREVSVHAD